MNIQTALGAFKISSLYGIVFDEHWLSTVEKYFTPGQSQPTIIALETHFPCLTAEPQTDIILYFSKKKLTEEVKNTGPFWKIAKPFEDTKTPYAGLWIEYDMPQQTINKPSIWLACTNKNNALSILESLYQQKIIPKESITTTKKHYLELSTSLNIGLMFSREKYNTYFSKKFLSTNEALAYFENISPKIVSFLTNIPDFTYQKIDFSCNTNTDEQQIIGIECECLYPIQLLLYLSNYISIEQKYLVAFTHWQQTLPTIENGIGRISHLKLLFNRTSGKLTGVKIYYGFETLQNFVGSNFFKKIRDTF